MFDELRRGPGGTLTIGGGQFEAMTTVRSHSGLRTMWVYGLHWPHCCECDGTHAPISFGEGHFLAKFHIANLNFWMHTGIDVREVEGEMNRWLESGDLPDWVIQSGPLPFRHERQSHCMAAAGRDIRQRPTRTTSTRKAQVLMYHHPTQGRHRSKSPGALDEDIIDLRRRRQRRGRTVLAAGCTIAYFPHGDLVIRVGVGEETGVSTEVLLDVAVAPGPMPYSFMGCLDRGWREVGYISHRWLMPAFGWDNGVAPCFEAVDDVAAKGFAAYYHLHKGYELKPEDGIVANPAPIWTNVEIAST